jgi:hypothetical protein
MAITITTPELGKVKKTAKDLVISTLMYEHPLNLAKITNSIKKKFQASVTFQGVRKAVNQLAENGVILKEGKEYSLSKEWVLKLRDFVEKLQESYFTESTGIREIQAIGEDIKVYTFDNLIDLDKFWNKVIGKWFEDDPNSTHDRLYVQQSGHTWYVLGQLEEETSILDKIKKYNIRFHTLAVGRTFLDKWCQKYYQDQDFFYKTFKKKGDTSHYFSIYNDKIIQTNYPTELTKEIDAVYSKAKNFESFEVAKLIKLLRKKVELKVTVMRNLVVAEQLRSFILSHFKKI